MILCGDHGPTFSHSFAALHMRDLVTIDRTGFGNRPPRSLGSSASPLMAYLDGDHYGARVNAARKVGTAFVDGRFSTVRGDLRRLGNRLLRAKRLRPPNATTNPANPSGRRVWRHNPFCIDGASNAIAASGVCPSIHVTRSVKGVTRLFRSRFLDAFRITWCSI